MNDYFMKNNSHSATSFADYKELYHKIDSAVSILSKKSRKINYQFIIKLERYAKNKVENINIDIIKN